MLGWNNLDAENKVVNGVQTDSRARVMSCNGFVSHPSSVIPFNSETPPLSESRSRSTNPDILPSRPLVPSLQVNPLSRRSRQS